MPNVTERLRRFVEAIDIFKAPQLLQSLFSKPVIKEGEFILYGTCLRKLMI